MSATTLPAWTPSASSTSSGRCHRSRAGPAFCAREEPAETREAAASSRAIRGLWGCPLFGHKLLGDGLSRAPRKRLNPEQDRIRLRDRRSRNSAGLFLKGAAFPRFEA